MTLHIANYQIVVEPAGLAVLAILCVIAVLGLVLMIRAIRQSP